MARYALRVPVLFAWHDKGIKQAGGFTRDVSTCGTYVSCESDELPFPGASVRIEMMLPPIDAEAHGVRLTSEGYVARTHNNYEECGFAVVANFFIPDRTSSTT